MTTTTTRKYIHRTQDAGCHLYPSCLNCPFPGCLKCALKGQLKMLRNNEIIRLRKVEGCSIKHLVQVFQLTNRQIHRILKEE